MIEHPFDEWFARTYPDPQPEGTKATAMIAWNAALHAARDLIKGATKKLVDKTEYEKAGLARDLGEVILTLRRKHK